MNNIFSLLMKTLNLVLLPPPKKDPITVAKMKQHEAGTKVCAWKRKENRGRGEKEEVVMNV